MDALHMAAPSGIYVKIIMPAKPDHMFVYWAGYSYIGQLLGAGVLTDTYDTGFIHAKTIVVDELAAYAGRTNNGVRIFVSILKRMQLCTMHVLQKNSRNIF
jgi:cardiolipin synthase